MMTYKEYSKTEEWDIYEVLDGQIINKPSSYSSLHQITSGYVSTAFGVSLRGKTASVYPHIDVYLFDSAETWVDEQVCNWLFPDLVVVSSPANKYKGKIVGAPDLVVEILSPSSAKIDRTIKRSTYERAGVKEYWTVDPSNQIVDVYLLDNGVYKMPEIYSKEDFIDVSVIDDLTIDLKDIFPEDEDM